MIQKNKELLLKDLCARLPYGVKIDCSGTPKVLNSIIIKQNYISINLEGGYSYCTYISDHTGKWDKEDMLSKCKPYLRPLSSMTEEEFYEYNYIRFSKIKDKDNYKRINIGKFHNVGIIPIEEYLNWLNANQFDYRGLIPKGLALEATEGIYKIK